MKNRLFVGYARLRSNVLSMKCLRAALEFLRLPEFKFLKTFGFIISVLM